MRLKHGFFLSLAIITLLPLLFSTCSGSNDPEAKPEVEGLTEKTIIIFASDNGGNVHSNKPGSRSNEVVSSIDYYLTMLEMANVQRITEQVIDGLSLVPVLNPEDYLLFDLEEDIGESKNLAVNNPEKVKELDMMIEEFLKETGALVPKANPAYQPVQ